MGRLPAVGAVTGSPTDDQSKLRSRIDRLSPAVTILLILLGPPGWLGLIVIGLTGPTLVGWLPYSITEAVRRKDQRRFVAIGTLAGVLGLLVLAALWTLLSSPHWRCRCSFWASSSSACVSIASHALASTHRAVG
jgi:hypothetical protein